MRRAALDDVVEDFLDRRGVTPEKLGSSWKDCGHRVISAKQIKEGRILLEAGEDRFVDSPTYEKWMRTPLKSGDVLLTSEAPLGELAYVDRDLDWCLGQRLFALRPKAGVLDGRFLYYSLHSEPVRRDLLGRATGTTVQGIRQSELRRVEVPVPPLPEQRAIAAVLGALDDKIDLNRRLNNTLEETARALFKSWFVDFDPVRAKADGRQPFGMDAATAALFPDSFEESELGEVPKGWGVRPAGEALTAVGGSTPSTEEPAFWGGQHRWARPKDLSGLNARVLLDTERTITDLGLAKVTSGLLPAGTVLLSSRAPIGYLAITRYPVAVNQGFIAMICDKLVTAAYTLHWCEAQMDVIKARASGTTFPEISKAAFRPIPMLVPSRAVLEALDLFAVPLLDRVAAGLQEANSLASLRDYLLPKLLSGEVRVRDAEKLVGEAT